MTQLTLPGFDPVPTHQSTPVDRHGLGDVPGADVLAGIYRNGRPVTQAAIADLCEYIASLRDAVLEAHAALDMAREAR